MIVLLRVRCSGSVMGCNRSRASELLYVEMFRVALCSEVQNRYFGIEQWEECKGGDVYLDMMLGRGPRR